MGVGRDRKVAIGGWGIVLSPLGLVSSSVGLFSGVRPHTGDVGVVWRGVGVLSPLII